MYVHMYFFFFWIVSCYNQVEVGWNICQVSIYCIHSTFSLDFVTFCCCYFRAKFNFIIETEVNSENFGYQKKNITKAVILKNIYYFYNINIYTSMMYSIMNSSIVQSLLEANWTYVNSLFITKYSFEGDVETTNGILSGSTQHTLMH